jgi:hypothetical protein
MAEKVPSTDHISTSSCSNKLTCLSALTHERRSVRMVEDFLTHAYSVGREEKNVKQQ